MPWARLDDRLLTNIKVRALSHPAFRMWVLGLVYCQSELTDGFIPKPAISLFGFRDRDARQAINDLCNLSVHGKEPLWRADEHGYHVHDYLQWNESREHVENKRRTSAERMKRVRANKPRTTREVRGEFALPTPHHSTVHVPSPTETEPPAAPSPPLRKADKEPDSPVRKLQLRYAELLGKNLGIPVEAVVINWSKAGSIFKGLLDKHEYETVLNGLEKFMADRDAFVVAATWQIGVFVPRFNGYIATVTPVAVAAKPQRGQTGVHSDWSDFK